MKRYVSTPYRLRAVVFGVAGLIGGLLSGWLLSPSVRAATVEQASKNYAAITIPVTLINIQATCDLTFTGLDGGRVIIATHLVRSVRGSSSILPLKR